MGLGLLGWADLVSVARIARQAEDSGFGSIWVAETQNRRDAITAVATALAVTKRVRVGTAAVNVFTRNAALVGLTFASLAEAYPGRVVAGIGVGSSSTLAAGGVQVSHPIGMLSEHVDVVRAVTAHAGPHTYQGRYVTLDRFTHACQVGQPPDLMLCVGGPQGLRLAARKADGVVLDLFLSPAATANQTARVRAHAGEGFVVAAGLMTSLDENVSVAMDRVRPILAHYLVLFPELVAEMGVPADLVTQVHEAADLRGVRVAGQMLDCELVDELAVCGPSGRCRRRIRRYLDAGVDEPVLFPEPESLNRVVFGLGQWNAGTI